jgi:hypothetical protein
VKYFQVFDTKSNSLPAPAYIWNYIGKNNVTPGETAKILTGSSANDVFLIQEINKAKTNIEEDYEEDKTPSEIKFISLNNDKKVSEFKTNENDRGGFGVNEFFVKDNRFYAINNTINVPWSNKELTISFDTWRDKTLPGSVEKWTVKITGNKGEKVGAEMLASMYDASLDQFRPHSWNDLSNIWPSYNGSNPWKANQNFTTVNSIEKYWNEPYLQGPEKRYDALNYVPEFNNRIMIRGAISNRADVQFSAPMVQKDAMVSEKLMKSAGGLNEMVADSAQGSTSDKEKNKINLPPIDQSQNSDPQEFQRNRLLFP